MTTSNFAHKLCVVAKNKAEQVFSPEFMRNESLIIASLVLVVSRIAIANMSAVNAKGTPDGPYRYRESIRTDIRELGGWSAGFLALRQFQSWIKNRMRDKLGIEKPEVKPENTYNLFGKDGYLAKAWDKSTKLDALAYKPDYTFQDTVKFKNGQPSELAKKLANMPMVNPLKKEEAQFIKGLYRIAPIAIGSVPTVLLAGYLLERITRDHSDAIVDSVSKGLRMMKGKDAQPNAVPSGTAFAGSPAGQSLPSPMTTFGQQPPIPRQPMAPGFSGYRRPAGYASYPMTGPRL